MNTVTAVLIGGPADGRRLAINPNLREVRVTGLRVNYTSHFQADIVATPVTINSERYLEVFGAEGVRVYAHESISYGSAMRALIEGYRPEIVQ
jgi:hypothetical protein